MRPVQPIRTLHLFPGLSRELIALLSGLAPADWDKPTACAGWSVKDVAAHLLGGSLGRAAATRPTSPTPTNPASQTFEEIVAEIDRSNAEWISAARRINPELLIAYIKMADQHMLTYFRSLEPFAAAPIPVTWAGEKASQAWFDIAREYTEKWLHQQHIREATGRPLLNTHHWLFPVLDTFLRALPYTYRGIVAKDSAAILFKITGTAGGNWSLIRQDSGWALFSGQVPRPTTQVTLSQDTAWRLFTKGIEPDIAQQRTVITGNLALGLPLLDMVSIMV